jgi:4-hydroxy-4-methyl-2-oxoglutarate aldolase
MWNDDEELFALMRRRLFTGVVGDVLDKLGCRHQFLPQAIKPLNPTWVIAGRALPILEADYFASVAPTGNHPLSRQPFGLMFQALDDLKPGEVYLASGASFRYALWGGLMSTRARQLQAAGAVLHGYSRDTNEILTLDFPTWSCGTYAQDQGQRGKVVDFRLPIEIDGIAIEPGDVVFGDRDGVLIIPQAMEEDAIRESLDKVSAENQVRKAIEAGMSATEAYHRFGVM